jgi:hypothetical protein
MYTKETWKKSSFSKRAIALSLAVALGIGSCFALVSYFSEGSGSSSTSEYGYYDREDGKRIWFENPNY